MNARGANNDYYGSCLTHYITKGRMACKQRSGKSNLVYLQFSPSFQSPFTTFSSLPTYSIKTWVGSRMGEANNCFASECTIWCMESTSTLKNPSSPWICMRKLDVRICRGPVSNVPINGWVRHSLDVECLTSK